MLPGAASVAVPAMVLEASQSETLAVLAQVADEMRANLNRIEQALDDFFRDTETREKLAGIAPLFRQVGGALTLSLADLIHRAAAPGPSAGAAAILGWLPTTGAVILLLAAAAMRPAEVARPARESANL